jgi:hypothetical protein
MALQVINLIAGPGTLYTGDFGATEPASSTINAAYSGSAFTDVGGTQDGVTINIEREFFKLEVDQTPDVPGRRLTSRDMQISTNIAEPTLDNLKLVLNGGTVTASAAYSEYEPADDTAATQPTYKALMFEGWAPQGFRRRVFGRKVLSIESVEVPYKKDGQTLFPVTFGCHYVSNAIKPFKWTDQTTA